MASAASAAAVLVLVVAAGFLPSATALIPYAEIAHFARDQIAAIDVVFWAREIGRAQREIWCEERGRRRPRDFPFTLGTEVAHPIAVKEGVPNWDVVIWILKSFGRAAESSVCALRKLKEGGRSCCCCCEGAK